jgi:IS5 family transposase
MLIVGYCYGIRFERRLCEEVELHLAYRWFCRLDLDDKVPDHSTFSVNRHGRFRDSNILRHVNEEARDHVRALMGTPEFEQSSDERKKVEMRFAHLKTHHRFERMRLRGLSGARDEFHLAAIAQNLKTLANHIWRPPPDRQVAFVA